MIAHVRGPVVHRGTDHVVIDVGGLGYLVHVASLDGIPPRGEVVELHTSMQVREDSMTLYGFRDRAGLDTFELLLTSSGVGPKLALAALRTHSAETLRVAIATADTPTLTAVPGIGKKVADRVVLELRDKVGAVGDLDIDDLGGGSGVPTTPAGEAREALVALGYSSTEVAAALSGIDVDGEVSDILRRALQRIGTAAGVR